MGLLLSLSEDDELEDEEELPEEELEDEDDDELSYTIFTFFSCFCTFDPCDNQEIDLFLSFVQMVQQSIYIPQLSYHSSTSQQHQHHSNLKTPECDKKYNERVRSFVLNTDNFAKLSKPTFKIIFSCIFTIPFYINLRVPIS